MDNDRTGDSDTEILKKQNSNVSDERILFKNHKDLNEFLINGNPRKMDIGLKERDLGEITTRKIGR